MPQSYVTDPQDAATWYYNLDHLMRHVNADGRVKVFYSTPLRYVEAKQKESQVKWPLKAPCTMWGAIRVQSVGDFEVVEK